MARSTSKATRPNQYTVAFDLPDHLIVVEQLADFNALLTGPGLTLTDAVNMAFDEHLVTTSNVPDLLPGYLPPDVQRRHLALLEDCIHLLACTVYPLTANAIHPPVAYGAEIDANAETLFIWISDPALPVSGPARVSFAPAGENRSRRH